MAVVYLETDESEEAVSALEAFTEWLTRVPEKTLHWRWVILTLHHSMQGFLVLALRGTHGLHTMRDSTAAKWIAAHETGNPRPKDDLDSFLNLYKKAKLREKMTQTCFSKPLTTTKVQDRSVKQLHNLRNDFMHFPPHSWLIEVSGLPRICVDCLSIIEFLGWKGGNVRWPEDERDITEQRALDALKAAGEALDRLDAIYSSRPMPGSEGALKPQ